MEVADGLTMLILNASNGSEAVTQSFAFRKAADPEFSLAWLARRLDLKSRGSLSEMLRGKKAIPLRLRRPLLLLLTKNEVLAEMIELLLDRQESQLPDEKLKNLNRLQALRTYLTDKFVNVSLNHGLNLFASDIYCAFDLFAGQASERQFIDYFGRERYYEVQGALRILILNELIELKDGLYQRTGKTKHLLTIPDRSESTVQDYLKESLRDALGQVDGWSRDQKMACFGSTVISVRISDYLKLIEQLKKDVFKYFSALETTEGETLIRFNMQVYPIKK